MTDISVYRNIKNGLLSIRSHGFVVGHCDIIWLENTKFLVNKKGVNRIRKTQHKSVVATISGVPVYIHGFESYKDRQRPHCASSTPLVCNQIVTFNPYTHTSFLCEREVVHNANFVVINSNGFIQANQIN